MADVLFDATFVIDEGPPKEMKNTVQHYLTDAIDNLIEKKKIDHVQQYVDALNEEETWYALGETDDIQETLTNKKQALWDILIMDYSQ